MEIIFSRHALDQLKTRKISIEIVEKIVKEPQQKIGKPGTIIYQSIVNFEDGEFLVRIIVNTIVHPNKIVTLYRTSK